MTTRKTQQKTLKHSNLYGFVFECVFVKYATGLLLMFFLLNPVASVFASEDVETQQEADVVEVEDITPDVEPEEVTSSNEGDVSAEDVTFNEMGVGDEEDVEIEQENDTNEQIVANETESEVSVLDLEIEGSPDSGAVPSVNNGPTETATTTADNEIEVVVDSNSLTGTSSEDAPDLTIDTSSTSTVENVIESNQSSGSEDVTDIISSETSTTSTSLETGSSTSEVVSGLDVDRSVSGNSTEEADSVGDSTADSLQQSSTTSSISDFSTTTMSTSSVIAVATTSVSFIGGSAYQFDDKECVSVGEGAFYCSDGENAPEYVEDGVYAAPDKDGDMEIFIRLSGEVVQITKNTTDDLAPYYDALSDRIVYHSMKNDRFQVVSYDLNTKETTYLTNTSYNNMEPVAYGDITLWQAWLDNNWEIIKHENGSTTRLTNNQMHDVSPNMRGGNILWQTQFLDVWKVAVYNIQAQSVEYIADGDGSLIKNPRMVLVYDRADANGDVRTVGYDFGSKSTFALGNLPVDLPDKLPEPDQTGETRALIQSKTNSREVEVEEVGPVPGANNRSASSTQESLLTLDLSSSTQSVATSTHAISDIEIPALSEPENNTASSTEEITSDLSHIEDVVIPSINATSTVELG